MISKRQFLIEEDHAGSYLVLDIAIIKKIKKHVVKREIEDCPELPDIAVLEAQKEIMADIYDIPIQVVTMILKRVRESDMGSEEFYRIQKMGSELLEQMRTPQ